MRKVTSSLPVFDKVNKHVTQVPHIECVYVCACLGFSICLLAMFMYIYFISGQLFMHASVCMCVCSGGCGCQSGGVWVRVWILYAHKKRSWDESGAAHVETLLAETVSMRSIMRQGWALMWLLSSPPIGSSLCVYVCVRVHVHELVSREGAAPSHPSFLSSLYPLKNTPKTTNWLWRASRWAHSFRRIGGPPPPQLPTVSSQWFSPAMALLS